MDVDTRFDRQRRRQETCWKGCFSLDNAQTDQPK